MAMAWNNLSQSTSLVKHDQKGQSMVEYIMLMAVIVVIAVSIFQGRRFQSLFGEQGSFAVFYKRELEYSYRHALRGNGATPETVDYNTPHDSYVSGGTTRFFGARESYPTR